MNLNLKLLKTTFSLCLGYLSLMVIVSCVEEPDPYPFGKCPDPIDATLQDLNVNFTPFIDDRYAIESDTVSFDEFSLVLEFKPEEITSIFNSNSFPGKAYALSCALAYNFSNISNISVTLNEAYGNLQNGMNITYLFEDSAGKKLSELKDFKSIPGFLGFNFKGEVENYSKLKFRTTIFLKNGSQIVVNSTSPTLKTT